MNLNEVKQITKACLYADVPLAYAGHRGIGKTQAAKQVAATWEDKWMETDENGVILNLGIPIFSLFCSTQDVPDLIGFPIQVWEESGEPVVKGVSSTVRNDSIITSWAKPDWAVKIIQYCKQFDSSDIKTRDKMIGAGASEEEIWAFWHRPKAIVFLDELKRAPREVLQAMYPFLIDKQLHMLTMPRGTRVLTADNYAGAYDLREPDEAFMSRLCHIDVDADINTWYEWAVSAKVHPKIRNFLIANPTMLMSVPKDQEAASVKYQANPDPRSWGDMVSRLEKYGRLPLPDLSLAERDNIIKVAIRGIVGPATCEAYWKFANDDITLEQVITGKVDMLKELAKKTNDVRRNLLKQKLQLEAKGVFEGRKFNLKEAEELNKFLINLNQRERATAILQEIFLMKNKNKISQDWIKHLMDDPKVMKIIKHLIDKKNI